MIDLIQLYPPLARWEPAKVNQQSLDRHIGLFILDPDQPSFLQEGQNKYQFQKYDA